MSHINFDFLTESFLFGYGLEDNFSALSDYELEKELNRYREYVISNMGEICREIIFDSRKIAVTIESFSERPREELLKQLALYVDVVTISDPLFELTEKKSNSTKVMADIRENIDTRAIFPLVSRYTGALPPNPPSHNILQNDYLTNSATKTKSLTSNFVISSR